METICSPETSVDFQCTTRHYTPEESNVFTRAPGTSLGSILGPRSRVTLRNMLFLLRWPAPKLDYHLLKAAPGWSFNIGLSRVVRHVLRPPAPPLLSLWQRRRSVRCFVSVALLQHKKGCCEHQTRHPNNSAIRNVTRRQTNLYVMKKELSDVHEHN
jgi:hypothetical protein